jgi:hypothetical protein
VLQALTTTAQKQPSGDYNFLTGFGIMDADAALVEAGRMMGERPARSQVSLSSHFGDGAAAVPAAPVAPRSASQLLEFAALAFISFAAAAGGLAVVLRRRRDPRPGTGAGAGAGAGTGPGLEPRPGPQPE